MMMVLRNVTWLGVMVVLMMIHFATTFPSASFRSMSRSQISFTPTTIQQQQQRWRPASSLAAVVNEPKLSDNVKSTDILICGGGPAGLLSAIMLAQKFPRYKIDLYDRLPPPPSPTDEEVWAKTTKHFLIGLGGRGITALEEFGVWGDVAKVTIPVPARTDWTPQNPEGVARTLTDRKYVTQVLPRDKLVAVLYEHIQQNYAHRIQFHPEHLVRPMDLEGDDSVLVHVRDLTDDTKPLWRPVRSKFVVASDGSARTFCTYMEEMTPDFEVVRYEDDNPRVYKSLPFQLPDDWRFDVNYGVRSKGERVIFDALPADNKGNYVGVLLMKEEDEMAQPNVDPTVFKQFLNESLPQFSPMFDDQVIVDLAKAPCSTLPQFRYVRPRMNHGKRVVLVGDCAHSVKPFFGMGANTALEDVKLLGHAIDTSAVYNKMLLQEVLGEGVEAPPSFDDAIVSFSELRAPDVATLVKTSHNLDRPGVSGTFSFLIPVIMDAIFHKLAPEIFNPNIISMIQSENVTFTEAVAIKRMDRLAQVLFLTGSLSTILPH